MNEGAEDMSQQRLQDKKIAVAGIGGVGGYLAGMLGRVWPDLTLIARGKRLETLRGKGLVLHSDYKGEIAVKTGNVMPADEMGEQDVIFVCVKNYSLEQVCEGIKDSVTENTIIVPVMNGVDPGERIRRILDKGTVVDSLIYIVSFISEDGSVIQQGDFASLRIGIQNPDEKGRKAVQTVSEILSLADIDHKVSSDIQAEIWKKYILNCAYNVETAFYDRTIGQLREDPVTAAQYEALVQEAGQVAKAKGVAITQEHLDAILYRFYHELADGATSSLQRDIRAGKPAEIETFSGYIVREANRLGISVPVSMKMYEGLKNEI